MNPPTALSAAPVPILQLHINHPTPDKVTLAQDAAAPDSSQCCCFAENVGLLLSNPPPRVIPPASIHLIFPLAPTTLSILGAAGP